MFDFKEIAEKTPDEVYSLLGSNKDGLDSNKISDLQSQYGKNQIKTRKKTPLIIVFLSNFISLMAILLWAGGLIAIISGTMELGIAIWLVNVINGVFSFIQEYRAEKATDALKKMLPAHARVLRDGKEVMIMAEDMVPGDVVLIEEGDLISADARLINATELQVDQSTLTGESSPAHKIAETIKIKDTNDFEFTNMIFAGTTASKGDGKAVVINIGMDTEFGKIAHLSQSMKEEKSPLQKELDKLTRQISIIAISIGIVFIAASMFVVHTPFSQAFIFALGMMVAFIPEGLLPTVSLSLAMAVQRMAKKHALVKKLSSVETLGATTVICSDKTGTLTKNEMTVTNISVINKKYKVTGAGYSPDGDILYNDVRIDRHSEEDLLFLLKGAALCSNAKVVPSEENKEKFTVLGDPTEACLDVVSEKAGINLVELKKHYVRLKELPFDSVRKRMTTINTLPEKIDGRSKIAFTKGAPLEVVKLASHIREDGSIRKMNDDDLKKIERMNDEYAKEGLRVLAVAYRLIDDDFDTSADMKNSTIETVEKDYVFMGLIVMLDPPHPEIFEAVEKCKKAKIKIIMITGDYGLTAESIAKKIGIVEGENPRVINGLEFEDMSDNDIKEALKEEVIFARFSPSQKYRVVENLQGMGNIVAVTGDGVNDAPALKKAEIGIAMGITGTDVAKESADMILTDDNFASIVDAIEEGRAVYNNIQKFLMYILNSNMSEAMPSAVFLFSKGGIPLPLTVMQILSIDLGTDMVPALGLGTEKAEAGIMDKPPRKKSAPLLNKNILFKAFCWYGLLEGIIAIGAYFWANYLNGWPGIPLADSGVFYREATTMTLAAIIFCQIGAVMNSRTEKQSVFKRGIVGNKMVNIGILFEIALLCILMYVPAFHNLFNTAPLGLYDWLYLICCPFFMIAVDELRKLFIRKKEIG